MHRMKRTAAIVATVSVLCVSLHMVIGSGSRSLPIVSDRQSIEEIVTKADENDNLVDEATLPDTDADGVADYMEDLFGTASDSADTDGDGLSDAMEILSIGTDALSADSDANGVADGDEDADGDRLTNEEECALATDPSKFDTDSDGIGDGEERQMYFTDPLIYDTDADGVCDGYERQLGTDPTTYEERFDVTQSCRADGDAVAASVDLTLSGEQVDSLSVEPTDLKTLFPEEMPGYIGSAYDLAVDGDFEEATISFEFDVSADVVEPTIYCFNQATQTLEAVETTVVGSVATASVDAAATYILLDRVMYEGSLTWEDFWGSTDLYSGLEVVLVIDDSGSMTQTDPNNERLTVARELIDRLPDNSRIGIVRFSSKAESFTSSLIGDKHAAKSYLTDDYFVSDGSTLMYSGITQALKLFKSDRPQTQRVMVVLSDGAPTDFSLRDSVAKAVQDRGVTTYTVSLGSERSDTSQALKSYATAVNGVHYTAEQVGELSIAYDDINKMVDITTDTDGDGIPDYYEDHMVAFNGVQIPLDKTKADTDYDGLSDSEEVSVELIFSDDGTQVYVKGMLLSDPTLTDTDGDGTPDNEDQAPYDNTFSGTLTTKYATGNVSFEMDYTWFFEDNTVYNAGLSKTSALFSSVAYEETTLSLSDALGVKTATAATVTEMLRYFGMENADGYSLSEDYADIHLSEVSVGYRNAVANGERKTVLAVVVRGTNSTIEEWSSNCDIGDIEQDGDDDDWMNTDNHKGFDIAANRIMAFVEQYIRDNGLDEKTLVYWVTGHSRGAGIANIIGANLEKAGKTAFTYTFAAPNTTLAADAASYTSIFNIINKDDFVPCLPIADWGYTCYGVSTTSVSIKDSYEKVWESQTGISDYNSDGNNMDACVAALAGILTAGTDPRVDCYDYTCACHGDGSNDTVTIKNSGTSESSRDNAIAKIPSNALPYCMITKYEGGWISGWDFEVCQTPAYFMQLLAAFMGGEINAYRFAVELNIADRYENAKTALIAVGVSGVEHPHYTETYYVLADNITAADFG